MFTFFQNPSQASFLYVTSLIYFHLNSPGEREQLLEAQGVDYLHLIDFTSCLQEIKQKIFFEKFVKRLKARAVVAGFDYHFGSDKKKLRSLVSFF